METPPPSPANLPFYNTLIILQSSIVEVWRESVNYIFIGGEWLIMIGLLTLSTFYNCSLLANQPSFSQFPLTQHDSFMKDK